MLSHATPDGHEALKATLNKSLVSRASPLWAVCSVAQRKGAFHTRLDTLMASAVFTFE